MVENEIFLVSSDVSPFSVEIIIGGSFTWADAACANMYFPFASPMQYTCGTTAPLVSSTCIFSLTGMKPLLSVSALIEPRFRPLVKGALMKEGEWQESRCHGK
jgi:hypothetical protein